MKDLEKFSRPLALLIALCGAIAIGSCKDEKTAGITPASSTPGGTEAVAAGTEFDRPLKADGDLKLQIITNGISPFWDAMQKGLEAESAVLKVNATRQSPKEPDNNAQKQVFDNAMAANVNGIAVSTIQADAFAPVIDDAIKKGVPVITFDSDSEKSKRLAYIGTNNYEAGKAAGQEAVKLFPNGGNVVAFVGNMSAQNARDRFNGFVEGVKGHKIEVLNGQPYEDDKDVGRARHNVGDAITKFGDKINGFLGLYSYNGPAIVDEVVKSGLLKSPQQQACDRLSELCGGGSAADTCDSKLEGALKKLADAAAVAHALECIDHAQTCPAAAGCLVGGIGPAVVGEFWKGMSEAAKAMPPLKP